MFLTPVAVWQHATLVVIVLALADFDCGNAQRKLRTNMSNQAITSLSEDELKSCQAKITYLGVQTVVVPTVVLGVQPDPFPEKDFVTIQGNRSYTNDSLPSTRYAVIKPHEFRRLLISVRQLVVGTKETREEFISFSVVCRTPAGLSGQEFRFDPTRGREFYERLTGALENNDGQRLVKQQFMDIYPGQ